MMKRIWMFGFACLQALLLQGQMWHHEIYARINHSENQIMVIDTLFIPEESIRGQENMEFRLNGGLTLGPSMSEKGVVTRVSGGTEGAASYAISLPPARSGKHVIPLQYQGKIEDTITMGAAEYARGFSETSGMISAEGIYLAGSSAWIPAIPEAGLFSFNLTVETDSSWLVVSQGTRTRNDVAGERRTTRYRSPDPVDEVFLVAGQWTEYAVRAGEVLVQAFLRTPDETLANRYLGVTSHYLGLYRDLIGPYPYTKFALVENFWETGYGMPSFTLLGPRVIRFPWILHSSYPHELLHNYWGNSVYVDYIKGNWCEGITVYMADHLIKEQQGQAVEYRRNTLQKFADYVNEENDFPPSGFISRNNPAEEAIGYGKVMMFNEMLRGEFGDETFLQAYAHFYERYRFRHASFDDIRRSFEEVTGKDLKPMFQQWIGRKGAPAIQLSDVSVSPTGSGYQLDFRLEQVQPEDPFTLGIPVAIWLEEREEVHLTRVRLGDRGSDYSLQFSDRPLKISIDPTFNVMRRLQPSEVPATLSQLFGARKSVIILPGKSEFLQQYRKLAGFWKNTRAAQGKETEIVLDGSLDVFPAGLPVWVMGFENRFYESVRIEARYDEMLTVEETETIAALATDQSLVYAIPSKGDPGETLGFIGTRRPAAVVGLSRKLLHYGSYGYLGFEGDAPDNVLKGVFPVLDSEMEQVIPYPDRPAIPGKLPRRGALASVAGD